MNIPHIILGGGLAGTTIAAYLSHRNLDFLLLEASPRLGGKIETKLTHEACFEFGPNSFTNQCDEIFDLLGLLGLSESVLEPAPAARHRYILKRGKIVRLPGKPREILTTKALSLGAKLRFFREIFHVPAKKNDDESVMKFFTRHFGREVAETFADPFVSGIFAGDPSRLSLQSAFPTMFEAEAKSKSLIRYLVSQRKTAKSTPQVYQLKEGLESIFHAARKKLEEEKIHLSEKVVDIVPEGKNVRIITDKAEHITARLYLTLPAHESARCLEGNFPTASATLKQIEYAPVVTAHLKIPKTENFHFNGFGILIPSIEKRKILGVLWNSSSFPTLFGDKTHHYITVYMGGARHPDLVFVGEDKIRKILSEELKYLFSLKQEPVLVHTRLHEKGIPQFVLGYEKILASLAQAERDHPYLRFAGNYVAGISIPKTVAHAIKVAAI